MEMVSFKFMIFVLNSVWKKIKTNASTKIKNPQSIIYSSCPTFDSKGRISAITSDLNTQTSLTTFDIGTGKRS